MRLILITGLVLGASAVHAAGTVNVSFIEPERFIDARDRSRDYSSALNQISDHLKYLASRFLPDGQQLKIEITDVDLAGDLVPTPSMTDQYRRVVGESDFPRIDLRYSLEVNGKQVRSGQESLRDMDYTHQVPSYSSYDPMRYEKLLLEHWFKTRFALPEPQ